jgi:hypothetical protein
MIREDAPLVAGGKVTVISKQPASWYNCFGNKAKDNNKHMSRLIEYIL